jgi:hypothetical protein
MILKEQVIKAIENLPHDVSLEDTMEKLYLLYKIDQGINQAEIGQKVSQSEAKKQMAKWLK